MKVEFWLEPMEVSALRALMETEHAGYYGVYGDGYVERRYGYFEIGAYAFKWVSQGGDALSIVGNQAMYEGRRHGLVRGGFLQECAKVLRNAQDRGDCKYIHTSEETWLPLETADDWPDQ